MVELTYEELLMFGSAMSIYFLFTFPIYVMFIIDYCNQLIHKIKERRTKKHAIK